MTIDDISVEAKYGDRVLRLTDVDDETMCVTVENRFGRVLTPMTIYLPRATFNALVEVHRANHAEDTTDDPVSPGGLRADTEAGEEANQPGEAGTRTAQG